MNAMTDRLFVDSNIWVYLFLPDDERKLRIAERFIRENGSRGTLVISYQVINEVSRSLYKAKFTETKLRNVIEQLAKICTVQDFSNELALMASTLREKHSFSFWDSHIVACAISAQCNILASEDMQDGFVIDGMTIKNIFI